MASLTGTSIQSTYDSLLKISGNDALTASLQRITDGLGNFTPLYLSTSAVEISSGLNVIGSITGSNLSGTNTGDETTSSIKTKLGAASSSQDGYLTSADWSTFNAKGSGSVTSVGLSAPTGFSVSGSPVTSSGTLALSFSAGYSLPTTASQTNWDTAYTNRITSLTTTGSSGAATLISNTLNIPNYTLSGLGGVPTSRTLTINGTAYDLSADRSWTISSSQWTTSGSNIYYNTGNVGIGTSSPGVKLQVLQQSITSNPTLGTGSGAFFISGDSGAYGLYIGINTSTGNSWLQTMRNDAATAYNMLLQPVGGNVGIGTTSPSYPLQVNGLISTNRTSNTDGGIVFGSPANGNYIYGADSGSYIATYTSNSERMRITSGGNVGIGTTSPAYTLDVKGLTYITPASGYNVLFQNSGTTLRMNYLNDAGSANVSAAYRATDFAWQKGDGAETMRITSGGNVGIGTTNAINRLHVINASAGSEVVRVSDANNADFIIGFPSAGNVGLYAEYGTGGNFIFGTGTGRNERMRINSNGNVSIGNTIAESFDIFGRRLVVGDGSQTQGITVYSGTSSGGGLLFADGTTGSAPYRGFVTYNHSTDTLSLGAGGDARIRIDSGGFVSVGGSTTYNTSKVSIEVGTDQSGITTNVNSSDTRYHLYFRNTLATVGSISTNSYATSFNTSSDYRLKEDYKPFNGLSILNDIKVYDFKWKGIEDRNYGVVAHEIEQVLPYVVNGEKDGEMYQSVDYSKLVPVLIQAIQEQQAQIDELKAKLK